MAWHTVEISLNSSALKELNLGSIKWHGVHVHESEMCFWTKKLLIFARLNRLGLVVNPLGWKLKSNTSVAGITSDYSKISVPHSAKPHFKKGQITNISKENVLLSRLRCHYHLFVNPPQKAFKALQLKDWINMTIKTASYSNQSGWYNSTKLGIVVLCFNSLIFFP